MPRQAQRRIEELQTGLNAMTTAARRTKFFEGSNLGTVFFVPVMLALSMYFYAKIVAHVQPLGIKIEDVYSYIFNLFAIELGAMLALFALFACRPTPFLERIKNTTIFSSIVANTNIALLVAAAALVFTLVLGMLRLEPDPTLTRNSVVFLCWFWIVVATTLIYVRTVRLMMIALAPG
jgi:hypothetical protein